MWGSGMNLITTVIGFGMSATFIVFICTRIICGRLRRIESRQMFEIESGIDLQQQLEHGVNGLEPGLVAAIPTMRFNYEAFGSVEDTQCSICLGEYQEKEVLRIMPKCRHNFHLSCIDVWLRKQSTCPVCRLPLQATREKNNNRLATVVSTPQSAVVDTTDPEPSIEHASQWPLPDLDRWVDNGISNQGHLDSVIVNTERLQISQESETRH